MERGEQVLDKLSKPLLDLVVSQVSERLRERVQQSGTQAAPARETIAVKFATEELAQALAPLEESILRIEEGLEEIAALARRLAWVTAGAILIAFIVGFAVALVAFR